MRSFVFVGLLLLFFCTLFAEISNAKKPKKINCQEIADSVNNDKNSLWTADTYGYDEIDVDEFVKTKLGVTIKPKKEPTPEQIAEFKKAPAQGDELPESFTWADAPKNKSKGCPIGVIRDQANCGSCWAVSTASAYSDRYCLMRNGTFRTPLSHEHLTACNKLNYGCNGGIMERAYNYLKFNGTVTGGEYESDEGCQPYTIAPCGYPSKMPCAYQMATTPKCREKKCNNEWYKNKEEKNTYKISYARGLYARFNDYEARREIYYNGPLVATFVVYPDFITYKKGIYEHKSPGWYLGGHAVRVVGWGMENNTKYWHVANSWTEEWGEKGYFRILRGYNMVGIESDMTALYPIVDN